MEDIRVTLNKQVTINLGNYSNIKTAFTVSADVADGETPAQVKSKMSSIVDGWIQEEIESAKEQLGIVGTK